MAPEKSTKMVLKVDLECSNCYMKVKKALCKFPQIRDQLFDEKTNTVTITVVSCSPEKIRDKLWCKGGDAIKCIKIEESQKPTGGKTEEKKVEKNPDEKPKSNATCAAMVTVNCGCPPQVYPQPFQLMQCCGQCYCGYGGGRCHQGCSCRQRPVLHPQGLLGPCHHGPVPPPPGPCCDGYGYGGNRACYVTRHGYFNEESCSFM